MKNVIGLFLVIAVTTGIFYGLHSWNQRKKLELELEIARLKQNTVQKSAVKHAGEKRKSVSENEKRLLEEKLKKAEDEKRLLEEKENFRVLEQQQKAQEEKQRLAGEEKKAEDEKDFQLNLNAAKKLIQQISRRRHNTPIRELSLFRQYMARLNPPPEILMQAEELPKIAMAIQMPSSRSAAKLPDDCLRKPPCNNCRGFGKHHEMDGHTVDSVLCRSCDGTGILQRLETRTAYGEKTIRVYKVKVDADPVFDLTNAQHAFKNRLDQLAAWLDIQ